MRCAFGGWLKRSAKLESCLTAFLSHLAIRLSPITGRSGPNLSIPKPAIDGGEATVTIRNNESSITRGVDDLLRVFERLPEHRRLPKPFA